jgi:dynactin complex subunit
MQLPDIIKSSRVGDKIKEGMEKSESGRGKDGKLGIETKKERMVFMEVWEKSMRRLCRYTRNRRRFHEALENELNKQGLGGSGQNVLEKEIENKY